MTEQQIHEYHLVSGEIVFRHDPEAQPTAVRANAIVLNDGGQFGVYQLGQAQQALQQTFHNRIEDAQNIEVLDVVIINIILLGLFTVEQFNYQPEKLNEAVEA